MHRVGAVGSARFEVSLTAETPVGSATPSPELLRADLKAPQPVNCTLVAPSRGCIMPSVRTKPTSGSLPVPLAGISKYDRGLITHTRNTESNPSIFHDVSVVCHGRHDGGPSGRRSRVPCLFLPAWPSPADLLRVNSLALRHQFRWRPVSAGLHSCPGQMFLAHIFQSRPFSPNAGALIISERD